MKRTITKTSLLAPALGAMLTLVTVACGGGGAATPAPAAPKGDGVVRPIAQGQLDVAHYATGDGVVGLVLDRTGPRPKMQMDGSKDIVELTMEEERDNTDRTGWFFRAPDGHRVLHLSTHGSYKIFTPSNSWGLALDSDRAADPLPAATVLAPAAAPAGSTGNAAAMKALAAIAVRTRFADLKPEDSANLAKIADAFKRATPDMFMHVTDRGAPTAHWAPASNHIGNEVRGPSAAFYGLAPASETSSMPAKGGLSKFGVKLAPTSVRYSEISRLHLTALKSFSPVLAPNTAGLVWETEPGLVFVTVDGGRYQFESDSDGLLAAGWGAASAWPPALQHSALSVESVQLLAKDSAISSQKAMEIGALDDAWFECVNDAWRKAKPELDKVEASTADYNTKAGQMVGVAKKAELGVTAKCGSMVMQLDVGLVQLIESRNAERQAIFDKAKTRAK